MKTTALAVAALVVLGCGGDPGPQEVAYRIDGATLDCFGSDPRDFRDEWTNVYDGSHDPMVTCGWFCATYDGIPSNEILIAFRFDGTTWVRVPGVARHSAAACD
jgi:hypothetical protein